MTRVPNQACLVCRGTGKVRPASAKGGVFAYAPCPRCMADPVSAASTLPPPIVTAPPPPPATEGIRVDLGTTDTLPAGFNRFVDIVKNPNVPPDQMVVADLTKKWPFEDNSVDYFRANDIIEHLPDKIFTMNEFYRCLKTGGTVEIFVPTIHGVGFISDPQHCSFWSRASFDYFTTGTPEFNRFAKQYGITGKFAVIAEERASYSKNYPSGAETVFHLRITLRAVKRNWKAIILSKNVSNLRRAVGSILATHTDLDPSNIIVVDDGAKASWTDSDPKVTWTTGKKPFVYAANSNIGIVAAGRSNIILMGDDCEVRSPWSFDFMDETASRGDAGVVSAGINGTVGNPVQNWRSDQSLVEASNELAFVTICIPRPVLDKVGLLDERFVGYGCEDVDYCWRARGSGFKFLVDNRAQVEHNPPGTPSDWRSRPDHEQRWKENMAILSDKWKRSYP